MDLGLSYVVHEVQTLDLPNLAATKEFAAGLAKFLRAGDLIALQGPLGVGKSELARALIQARAGSAVEVPSPTFTIIQDYEAVGLTIRHIDLYRIGDPDELFELGLEETPGDDEAWLVEWPERADGRLAGTRLNIVLEDGTGTDTRVAHLTYDQRWTSRMNELLHD